MEWMFGPADRREACDVLIIGAGPAGLAAACSAARPGTSVIVADDNPSPGGQIWRREQLKALKPEADAWLSRAREADVRFVTGARVFDSAENLLLADAPDGIYRISYRKLILATGARERFLPFPGWTLPNVCGAGGLQALVKSGLPIAGKRVVVSGTGPLLPAVADYLKKRGAEVVIIAEQASLASLARFGIALAAHPRKLAQAVALRGRLARIPYRHGCWVEEARGAGRVTEVRLRQGERTWTVACDYLACGFHLVPNTELAALVGCDILDGAVRTGELQETSLPGVYCAGESSGIGGLELALAEGHIAALAATGRRGEADAWLRRRARLRAFARLLERTF